MIHAGNRRDDSKILVTHCIFCDKEAIVIFREATDYVCDKCRKSFDLIREKHKDELGKLDKATP